jgi:MFS family permease
VTDLSRSKNNVWRLAIAQALGGANATVVFATGAVTGHALAPSESLATLPISIFVVGMAAGTLPVSAITHRFGRNAAFQVGTACGIAMGLIAALALYLQMFMLFCLAMVFGGIYAAVVLSFRFAAAECVAPADRAKALSTVLAGGVVAGVIGPQMVTYTMYLYQPAPFMITYICAALVALGAAFVLNGVSLPRITAKAIEGGRSLGVIVRQPRFIGAVVCGVVSYALMNFLMTSAPLAMKMHGHSQEASNLGLQWHVIAMYGPSFFTGKLITRFGAKPVVVVGLALIAASAVVGLMDVALMNVWVALILLGVGWNFGFAGASALVLECHEPAERARVQGLNDFIVFGTMALGSFASGDLLARYGWEVVCWLMFPPVLIAVLTLIMTRATGTQAAGTSAMK